jgi:EmrB/QacA subfamily drug resistance transporter
VQSFAAWEDALPELSRRRRLLVLGICCLSLFIVGLDTTIVNVALPSIGHQLHASVSGLQWTIAAYTLVLASLLMFSGAMADRVGRRRTFQTGLAIFTLASLLCSLAPSLGWLIAFRVLQAVGGSMLNPVAMSIIRVTFTDAGERARAIGIWDSMFGLSMVLGPVAGGLLVGSVGWRGIFWVNIPVGLAAAVLAALFIPESKSPRPRRPDPVGQVLLILVLGPLTYAIIEGPNAGWGSVRILGFFALAGAALVGLLTHAARRDEPVIDLRFFRSAPFTGAILTAICAMAALSAFLFLNTLYLQDVRGFSALGAGLHLLPMAAMMAVCAPISGRILARRGPRVPMVIAGAAMTLGGALLFGLTTTSSTGFLVVSFAVFGVGYGLVNSPITYAAVSGMPGSQAGLAGGISSASRQVGQSLGVAVAGSLLDTSMQGTMRAGFIGASRPAWWIVAGCGYAVLVLGVVTTSRWAEATAARTAARLDQDVPEPPYGPAMSVASNPGSSNRDASADTSSQLASRAWRGIRALVLDDENVRRQACAALSMNFIQVRAVLQLAAEPLTMRGLAATLGTDAHHTMLVVCDLEDRDLAVWTGDPSGPYPRVVALTATGLRAAATAERILGAPPQPWRELTTADLKALDQIMTKLRGDHPNPRAGGRPSHNSAAGRHSSDTLARGHQAELV